MLETTNTEFTTSIQPRERLMVMIAMNDEVPDEFDRFHQLAAERGARAVIIGPPDQELQDPRELTRYLAMAEAGAVDLDWLVVSGHSTGSSTWGNLGRFQYSWLPGWAREFPSAFAQIERLNLLNCYNVTPERARNYWPSVFPNVQAAAGFMYSAPGVGSQSSDEFLLNSGRIMMELEKGVHPAEALAERLARAFERDEYILWQNAALFVRTEDNPDGVFGMTTTARRNMEQHGAEEELRAIPQRFTTAFSNYYEAATPEFADPPHGHESILRQYLGAVQHIVDRWEGRMAELERWERGRDAFFAELRTAYEAEHGSLDGFRQPWRPEDFPVHLRHGVEEFRSARNWNTEYERVQRLRAKILNLVKSSAIQDQFSAFYEPNVIAFNEWLERSYDTMNAERTAVGEEALTPVLLPPPGTWSALNRMEMRQRIREVDASLDALPAELRREVIHSREWIMMNENNPREVGFTSPRDFFARLEQFVDRLDPSYIQPEWLDASLMANDLRSLAQSRRTLPIPEVVEESEAAAQPEVVESELAPRDPEGANTVEPDSADPANEEIAPPLAAAD
jgi:hypothetical protein